MRSHVLASLLAATTLAFISPSYGKPAARSGGVSSAWVIRQVPLPGNGRGDYLTVDTATNRLFVTHGSRVHIVALDTLSEVATLTGLRSSHGVAVAHGTGFVADGTAGEVVALDAGYFDQPHMIRDVNLFAGLSPTALITEMRRNNFPIQDAEAMPPEPFSGE